MSETNAQEPTMEEILASIRRIISEDDVPAPAAEAVSAPEAKPEPAPPPTPAAVHAAPVPPAPEDDVLELTDPVEAAPPPAAPPAVAHEPHRAEAPKAEPPPARYEETVGDLDVFSISEHKAPSHHAHAHAPTLPPPTPAFAEEPLVGSYAAETTAGHFGALARSISMPKDGRSLEDLVREMLKPMLRDWLDQHLPAIVEARVQTEVERIARRQEY